MRYVKLLSILLAIFLVCMPLSAAMAQEQPEINQPEDGQNPSELTYGPLFYEIQEEQAVIVGVDREATGEITVPGEISGYPVTAIAGSSFNACENITSVILPNTVTRIGYYTFTLCDNLEQVVLPESVRVIEEECFLDCPKLKEIFLSANV